MKKEELLKQLARVNDDSEIVVVLKQAGVGGTPCTPVVSASFGIDWDNGKVMLKTEHPVVTEEHLERIQKYARAYEKLLYFYAMENELLFNGQPLMGSKSCPKGSTVRTLKEYMKRDAQNYLDSK